MGLFISHQSALEYWRIHYDAPQKGTSRRNAMLPDTPAKTDLLQAESLKVLSRPLHVMLGSQSARRVHRQVVQHIYGGKTPAGCFVSVGEGIMITSPEFCFLQLADELPLVKLIELGYELCGTYSMPVSLDSAKGAGQPARGFNLRLPITSTKKLKAFLEQVPGVKGHKKAVRALRYIADGAASPMEAKLAILLTLPYKLGGYHFPAPELNSRIIPAKTAKRGASKGHYACDLFWPDYDLAVEYDSDTYHTGPERIAADSKKRNALALMGITVITVTKEQVYSIVELEKVVHVLAGNMGRRLWNDNPGFGATHRELRKLLF